MRLPWRASIVLVFASTAAPAVAQMGEPHGYIEPCTIGNYQEMRTECELCPVKSSAPEACAQRLGDDGYQKKCRTRGDHAAWEEVWCVDKRPGEARSGQTTTVLIAAGVSAALLAGFLLLKRALSKERSSS